MEVIMRTKTTLLAIFVIVTAITLVTAGSITASTLAVKKKSTVTTKKSTGSKKIKSPNTSTGGSATTTTTTGTGNSTLGRIEHFSKFIICMRLLSGPLTRPNVDHCYNIAYGTSSTSSVIGSLPNASPISRAVPKTSNIGPSSSSSSTTLRTP
jgi:hypothetical protein